MDSLSMLSLDMFLLQANFLNINQEERELVYNAQLSGDQGKVSLPKVMILVMTFMLQEFN